MRSRVRDAAGLTLTAVDAGRVPATGLPGRGSGPRPGPGRRVRAVPHPWCAHGIRLRRAGPWREYVRRARAGRVEGGRDRRLCARAAQESKSRCRAWSVVRRLRPKAGSPPDRPTRRRRTRCTLWAARTRLPPPPPPPPETQGRIPAGTAGGMGRPGALAVSLQRSAARRTS